MGGSFDGLTSFKDVNITGAATFSAAFVKTSNLAADLEVPVANTVHRHVWHASQAGTPVAQRIALGEIDGSGSSVLEKFIVRAVQSAAVGNATVTVDLYKNGASVLTAPLVINAAAGTTRLTGVLSSTSLTDGDLLESVVTVNAGTGTLPVGVLVQATVAEKPSL